MNDTPILSSTSPFFSHVHHGQIKNLQKAVVGWEYSFRLCYLAELTVEVLNSVSRVDERSDLLWVLEIG